MLRRLKRRPVVEVKRVFQGASNLLDWIRSGRAAVSPDQSASRAAVCVGCPKNGSGALTKWFTEPVSTALKEEIQKRGDFQLATPFDASLGVCQACFCPLPTKVHEPLDLVLKHLKPEVEKELWEKCWIRHESKRT